VKNGHNLKNIGSRVMGLVDNDVEFNGGIYILSFKVIAQVVLKLWAKCIYLLNTKFM
jgi:hypothetical protein